MKVHQAEHTGIWHVQLQGEERLTTVAPVGKEWVALCIEGGPHTMILRMSKEQAARLRETINREPEVWR